MASDEGLCVAFVSGLSASHKKKGRRAPGFSILFYVHTHSHEPGKKRAPSQSGAISRASHVAPRLRWPLAALSSRAVVNKKRLRVMSRAQKRAGGADDAIRRNRRRTRTTHLARHPAASNGALIRLRQVENQSAPLPCLPFISHRRRAVHGANGKFHLVENLGIRSECGVIVIILNKTYH